MRTNWAGNLSYEARALAVPGTIPEVQEIVRQADKVRALGSRHCFNPIADTSGVQISMEKFRSIISLDEKLRQVTVQGGTRYGDLGPLLHEAGYTLPNFASLPHISIAGAIATATHGSGMKLGGLATSVAALEFVTGAGDIVRVSREEGERFNGAVVHLGCLGIITSLTLDIEPAFDVHQFVYRDLPLEAVLENFEAIMGCAYSVSLFTDWQSDLIGQLWVKSRVDQTPQVAGNMPYYGAMPAEGAMHPVAGCDAVHCTEQLGVAGAAHERLPHFRMGFTPASGAEIQVEYFVPLESATDAIRALRAVGRHLSPYLMISEVRTVAADEFWMSPFYRQPCVAFHFSFERNQSALMGLLPHLEAALAPFGVMPHWGKVFALAPDVIRSRYSRLEDFRDLVASHDVEGKFRNAFVERLLFDRAA